MWLPDLRCLNEISLQVVVAMMRRKGLSGVVSALLITVVLVAGLASASYVNMTAVKYNEANMQEALRQARLGSELIRIHIHSADGSVDSPPRITFVNAWGFESRIKQLVIIARNMSVLAAVNLTQPIVLPPGSRLTVDPSQIGLGYRTFRELADNIRSIHAYTEAGNSFGSTWGFPREDNMAGRTVAVTYNGTTTEIWNVPSTTWANATYTRFRYTTLGDIPPVVNSTIRAVHRFERLAIYFNEEISSVSSSSWSSSREPADPAVPTPDPSFRPATVNTDTRLNDFVGLSVYSDPVIEIPYSCGEYYTLTCYSYKMVSWYYQPVQGWADVQGVQKTVEGNTYFTVFNGPQTYTASFVVNNQYQVAVTYRLGRILITPTPPSYQPAETTVMRTGMAAYPVVTTHTIVQVWDPYYGYHYYGGYRASPPRSATRTVVFFTSYTTTRCWPGWFFEWYCESYIAYSTFTDSVFTGPTITAFNPTMRMRLHHGGSDPYKYLGYADIRPPDRPVVTYTGVAGGTIIVDACDWEGCSMNALRVRGAYPQYVYVASQILQPLPVNSHAAAYVLLPPGNYTVERYYYVEDVQVQAYSPPSRPSWGEYGEPGPCSGLTYPPPASCKPSLPPPRNCDIVAAGTSDSSPQNQGGVPVQRFTVKVYVARC